MAADDIWIVGSNMTKFGKHPTEDVVDLASEAAMAALADAGITMAEVGVLGVGNLMNAGAGIGQQLQKQIGQTGIPVYNVSNACATGATALRVAIMAVRAGETDVGMAVGVEKLAGAGLLGQGAGRPKSDTWEPAGRVGAIGSTEGRIGTNIMPGVFAQVGMEYGHKYGGTSFELFAKISEKNHAHSTLNPLAAYQKRFTLEEIMNDVMIAYPNHPAHVLGQLRRRCGHDRDERCAQEEAVEGPAKARRQDQCVCADHRSLPRGLPSPPRCQHPHPKRREAGVRTSRCRTRGSGPGGAP